MNDNNKNTNHYSAADIKRYLKGEMSSEEMHAIEIAALEDPFLADAIEGFETAMAEGKESSVNTSLAQLNREFNSRIKKPANVQSITQSRWWQFAAAALIIIITGVAVYNNFIKTEQNNQPLAVNKKTGKNAPVQEKEKEKPGLSAFSDSGKDLDAKSTAPTANSAAIEAASSEQEFKRKLSEPNESDLSKKEANQAASTTIENRESTDKEEINARPLSSNIDSLKTDLPSAKVPEAVTQRNNELALRLNNFSGRVVDPNNKPLPYATLEILQNKTKMMADEAGNFNFESKDSIIDVQVDLVGFQQRNFRLQNSIGSNNLVLEPSAQLEDVVVTGYGSRRKKAVFEKKSPSARPDNDSKTKATVKVQNAVPRIGWIEYEKYLEKNKRPPASNPLLKGEVVVSFQVRHPGMISDYKIEQSLSKDHDEEAIRLIREGPKWKLISGHKTRITVIVKF
jgi:hypothetical protein